ncbi:MAG: hypothetical protein M3Y39_06175 [Chloroflexota bacterium]|nr:hypothetical protein [Chloroflexota bacterium]
MPEQDKPKVDARSLIAKLSKESAELQRREIIAPLLLGGRIRTRLSGMVHEFRLRGEFTGWGRFHPVNEREAELLGEALPWERGGYLELFPSLRVILLWPDSAAKRPGTWWALPFNASDAKQRFGFQTEPLPVFLCDPGNGAERFERVIARVDGGTLWFEGPDSLADPTHAEWLRDASAQVEATEDFLPGLAASERLALLYWRIRQIEMMMEPLQRQQATGERGRQDELQRQNRQQQRQWLRQGARHNKLETHLQHALAKADATLHSFSELPNTDGSPGHLVVEWSEHGQRRRYRSTIDARLGVVSSGICLSGRDRQFDLTSLVSVMAQSPWS